MAIDDLIGDIALLTPELDVLQRKIEGFYPRVLEHFNNWASLGLGPILRREGIHLTKATQVTYSLETR